MPFGISSASEIMQKRNEETFGDIQGVHVIADDLIIAATADQEHDIILNRVLQRARNKGVTFNSDKIQFKINEAEYTGNLVSSEGLKPDPKKIEAIVNRRMSFHCSACLVWSNTWHSTFQMSQH